jgi:uncharacterized protein (DUF2342 family)
MADLPGGGETSDVAVTGERANEADLELETATEGVGPMRSMPGLLGVLAFGATVAAALPYLPVGLRNLYIGGLDQLCSSPAKDRLPDQVRDNGN